MDGLGLIRQGERPPVDAGGAGFSRGDARWGGASERADFAAVLGRMQKSGTEDDAAFARRSAEHFVAITLVQPVLKQMRESNHAPPPFGPTDGEKQFQGLMDAELAQRMVKSAQFPLVDRVAHDLLARSGGRARPAAEEITR